MQKAAENPVRIIDEIDSFYKLPGLVYSLGSRALVVQGKSFLKKFGYLEKLESLFRDKGIAFVHYNLKHFESDIRDVLACIHLIHAHHSDVVVAFGGGAVIDVGKAAAGICNEPDPSDTFYKGLSPQKIGIPLIAVPTIAGTGAEVTPNAVISDEEKNIKKSIRSPVLFPHTALLDARLTLTVPQAPSSYSGSDALCQAIEAYVSTGATDDTDELSQKAIRYIGENLMAIYERPLDLAARKKMLTGSVLAALAFSRCRLGAVHGMAHPIGIRYKIPHGLVCAILLPPVMEHNLPCSIDKYADIGNILTGKTLQNKTEQAFMGINAVRKCFRRMNLDITFSSLGVTEDFLDDIVKESLASSSMKHNPRPYTEDDVKAIFKRCL
ncbi:MAG: iron-containing alcohol dehydrogenase [Candidatus Aureabacteria bacterium]|nr:iron-containing alcohol dehydrogenase [Candidatus Auribacterota bacterium]